MSRARRARVQHRPHDTFGCGSIAADAQVMGDLERVGPGLALQRLGDHHVHLRGSCGRDAGDHRPPGQVVDESVGATDGLDVDQPSTTDLIERIHHVELGRARARGEARRAALGAHQCGHLDDAARRGIERLEVSPQQRLDGGRHPGVVEVVPAVQHLDGEQRVPAGDLFEAGDVDRCISSVAVARRQFAQLGHGERMERHGARPARPDHIGEQLRDGGIGRHIGRARRQRHAQRRHVGVPQHVAQQGHRRHRHPLRVVDREHVDR